MKTVDLKKDLMIWASGFYLSAHLPGNWETWDEEMQSRLDTAADGEDVDDTSIDEWVKQHAWEPFEYYDAGFLWEQIDHLASSMVDKVKELGVEAT